MPRLRVHGFSLSLDGYTAGPDQSLTDPIGVGAGPLHEWLRATKTFRARFGKDGGEQGTDDAIAAASDAGVGATIMGRNMFGPMRGPWADDSWTGWWGGDPPFHHPVFVLTNHPRAPIALRGGTTFHFVRDGIESALAQAFAAADGLDVRIGGGASTIRQYLTAGLVDELHLVIAPVLLGSGERLFADTSGVQNGYECVELVTSRAVAHVQLARRRE